MESFWWLLDSSLSLSIVSFSSFWIFSFIWILFTFSSSFELFGGLKDAYSFKFCPLFSWYSLFSKSFEYSLVVFVSFKSFQFLFSNDFLNNLYICLVKMFMNIFSFSELFKKSIKIWISSSQISSKFSSFIFFSITFHSFTYLFKLFSVTNALFSFCSNKKLIIENLSFIFIDSS